MKITFIKDCPPCQHSGNSAYKAGEQADLRHGKQLVIKGVAREGWGKVSVMNTQTPAPEPKPTGGNRIIDATAAAIRLAADNGLDLAEYDGKGTGDNGRILVGDVREWVDA